ARRGVSLPELPAVARHGVRHRTHAGEEEIASVGGEVEGEDPADVVVVLDDAPAREGIRLDAADLFPARQLPDADLAHEVPGREKATIGAPRDGLDRGDVAQGMEERP